MHGIHKVDWEDKEMATCFEKARIGYDLTSDVIFGATDCEANFAECILNPWTLKISDENKFLEKKEFLLKLSFKNSRGSEMSAPVALELNQFRKFFDQNSIPEY